MISVAQIACLPGDLQGPRRPCSGERPSPAAEDQGLGCTQPGMKLRSLRASVPARCCSSAALREASSRCWAASTSSASSSKPWLRPRASSSSSSSGWRSRSARVPSARAKARQASSAGRVTGFWARGSVGPCPSALTVDWAPRATAAWGKGGHPIAFACRQGCALGGGKEPLEPSQRRPNRRVQAWRPRPATPCAGPGHFRRQGHSVLPLEVAPARCLWGRWGCRQSPGSPQRRGWDPRGEWGEQSPLPKVCLAGLVSYSGASCLPKTSPTMASALAPGVGPPAAACRIKAAPRPRWPGVDLGPAVLPCLSPQRRRAPSPPCPVGCA